MNKKKEVRTNKKLIAARDVNTHTQGQDRKIVELKDMHGYGDKLVGAQEQLQSVLRQRERSAFIVDNRIVQVTNLWRQVGQF